MSDDIEFEEEYGTPRFHIKSRKLLGEPTTPTMVNFLLQKKIAKDEKQALIILACVIVFFLSTSIFIINKTLSKNNNLVIINKYGQEIPLEDYINMINQGIDPILR
jgi:hypothetical protein